MPAPITLLDVSASRRRTAGCDIVEHTSFGPREPTAARGDEVISMGSDDVGDFQPSSGHALVRHACVVERAFHRGHEPSGYVRVERRAADACVAEYNLDRSQVGTGFQDVGGERVP